MCIAARHARLARDILVAQHVVGDGDTLAKEVHDELPVRDAGIVRAVSGVVIHVELGELVGTVVLRARHDAVTIGLRDDAGRRGAVRDVRHGGPARRAAMVRPQEVPRADPVEEVPTRRPSHDAATFTLRTLVAQ